jgi:putative endonuclease
MFYTYILVSISSPTKTYIGFTNSLENRLLAHNHENNKGYTAKFKPWKIIHHFEFETKNEALSKERWLKSGVGREWLKNISR